MYLLISSVITLAVITSAYSEERIMDIPIEKYEQVVNNRCISDVNFTACTQSKHELYLSVKIRTKTSDIINAECCLYRTYLDCFDDALYSAGCKKEVFSELKAPVYDHFYNFDTKCPGYGKKSWTVGWFCPWPWYVWTLIALILNMALICTAYCIFVSISKDRK